MPIKTFRGLMVDNAIDTVSLHTRDGSIGYRIKKFSLIPGTPGASSLESVVKIYTVPQTTASSDVDFSDQTLLAVAYFQENDATHYPSSLDIIFDNMIFNQDIYITHADRAGSATINYYIELEQMKLDLNENTVATLKDIRNVA
jgi:hypothetical protein